MTAISLPISRGSNWQTAARHHQGLILSIVVFATSIRQPQPGHAETVRLLRLFDNAQ